jgi:hypothetical protein
MCRTGKDRLLSGGKRLELYRTREIRSTYMPWKAATIPQKAEQGFLKP